ncbi:MAG TPA: DUF4864 domain-containing protein [Chthoniobacterales bacterium]|jgi:hypothetical protein
MNRTVKASLLLFFFALCGAAILATHNARNRIPPPPAKELFSLVNRQLSAFRAADFERAYRHAAGAVQERFSPAQFELMIRRDFSSMTEAQRVEFGAVHVAGATALVQVFLIAPNGAVRGFLYSFTAEPDGWKIDGVQPLGRQPVRRMPGLHV